PALGDLAADVEHRKGAGDNGLDARILGRLAELQSSEQVGAVRHAHRRHSSIGGHLADLAGLDRPFQKRIGAADPQVDEALTVHRIRQSKTPHRSARSYGRVIIMQGVARWGAVTSPGTPPARPSRRSRRRTQATADPSPNASLILSPDQMLPICSMLPLCSRQPQFARKPRRVRAEARAAELGDWVLRSRLARKNSTVRGLSARFWAICFVVRP